MVPRHALLMIGLLGACRPVRHESSRPIPPEPTQLAFATGVVPPGIGGGVYDLDAGVIVINQIDPASRAIRLMMSRHEAAGWRALAPAIPGFDAWHAGAQVSPDGSRLYFESNRRNPPDTLRQDSDTWVAERVTGGWGKPRPLGHPFDSPHQEHNVTVSSKGTICINSNRPGITLGHDILCARQRGAGWEEPQPLGPAVNGRSADVEAFLDPAERFIIFASNRPGGFGRFDLYISVNRNGEWQPAVNLGPGVNGPEIEASPAVSADGQRLLLLREMSGGNRLLEMRFDPKWTAP